MSIVETVRFEKAVPVWQAGMEKEKNHNLLFRAVIPAREDALLRIAGHTRFQVRVNGRFLAAGPARAGHGYYRVDEYSLAGLLTEQDNVITVLMAGYNVNSFAYLDMPSFLCCEVLDGEELLAATGVCGFTASVYTQRVKKVQRYSFQRPFVESYRFDAAYEDAAVRADWKGEEVSLVPTEEKNFIPRRVPYTVCEFVPVQESYARGSITPCVPEKPFADRSITEISPILKGYTVEELEEQTIALAESWQADHADTAVLPGADADIPAGGFAGFRLPSSLTGMPELTVTAESDTTLILTFDEILVEGRLNAVRNGTSNVIVWHLAGGSTYRLLSFEPYTMQYLQLAAVGGAVQVRGLGLRRYDFPAAQLTNTLKMPTERLQAVYDAAVETFRQNTVDIYMDCPSRERAGWLCDSFFTSRVEHLLTGRSTVERCFLENFLLPESFEFLPKGMLPMCYPSDHNDRTYIPNWAMWFVLELEEYLQRSGDRALVDAARTRVYELLDFFKKYENADGLLEKLDSWVFLEWSRSNELVQDISFPSNMLYARTLEAVAALYGDDALRTKAKALKETIRSRCFLGDFFCDNAVYDEDGVARLSGEATESCQYYAFFTGVATPAAYPLLWKRLVEDFGPQRRKTGAYPHIAFANAFIGNYLRLELLYRAGLTDEVLENIDGYFHYMAERTGTLWENVDVSASCNHGFASHVLCWLHGIYGKKEG
ncbi:MAG: hypothetical protein IJ412_08085 [Oscillospiraceae bacterium]|nr:hypothetical protein [Oscillospiraceae bacterium]